ncbi:MAG: EF-P lysine aminoacylase EpmA [Acinetobacter sp.]|nr:EF-P lysine aminoacylase EpmA [Acinetobacter sp.]
MSLCATTAFAACSLQAIQQRAELYAHIRQFFAERNVLEVETPLLSQAGTTDVHLSSIAAQRHILGQKQTHYLHTSPEFAMKRLLASGSGAIYQLCKVFRDDEHGRKHNSEFTMLEWYRPNFNLQDLMKETHALVEHCLQRPISIHQQSYKQVFQHKLGINPLQSTVAQLKAISQHHQLDIDLGDDRLAYLDLLFSHLIEPDLGKQHAIFLTDFPKELASLAKVHVDDDGDEVASRFELYINGLELANAYDELADAEQLRQRFIRDNQQRQTMGIRTMPIDEHLLAALPAMPACSGIALGVDRLLMIKMGKKHLHDVLAFPAERA